MARRQHTVSIQVAAECDLECLFCNRQVDKEFTTESLRRQIKGLLGKGPRKSILGNVESADAEIRIFGCDPLVRSDLDELVAYSREVGFSGVSVVTNGLRLAQPERAARLVDAGVSEVVLTAYSTDPRVHDALVRKKGAHARFLEGLAVLSGLDVDIRLQIPILSPRAQNLPALLDDLSERLDRIVGVELSIPNSMPPGKTAERLAPPELGELRHLLRRVMKKAEDLAIPCVFFPRSGVPFCGIPEEHRNEEVAPHHPNKPARLDSGNTLGASCGDCAMEKQCTGVRSWYYERYGDQGFLPFDRPMAGKERIDTLREHYSDPLVRARASRVKLKVVRPVIHCNQRCPFCSANETSEAQLAGRKLKKKLIRWYSLGVRRLSFSGGEPTLDEMLPEYFRLATQLGYSEIEIVTNGTKTHKIDYTKELVDAGLNRAFLSLHANNEELSAICTGRDNDFQKTVDSIHNFVELGVATRINHVVTTLNAPYIPEFVTWFHEEFGSDVHISFAFVSPLYRAAENLELIPRYRDVAPKLKEAMDLLREWDHPFVVLARAGVPWCQLRGGYMQYSDLPEVVNEAHSEDAYKKVKGPDCEECAIFSSCPGVYREYADLYGTDELTPLTNAEVEVSPTSPNDPWEGVRSKNWGNFVNHMDAFEQVDWDQTDKAWAKARQAADAANLEVAMASTLEALGFEGSDISAGAEGGVVERGKAEDLPLLEQAVREKGVERIEEFAYLQGLKPVLYLTPQPEELAGYHERYQDHCVEVVQAVGDAPLGRGVSTEHAHLFVSRDAEKAQQVAEVYRSGDPSAQAAEVGELMGYPRCCVAAFLALADRSNDSEIVYAVAKRGCEHPHPLLNLGIGYLIPFYPCRFDCSEALSFAERVLEGLFPGEAGAGMRQSIFEEMASPTIYFDKERALIFDGRLEQTRIRFDAVRYVSRTRHSDQEALLMRRALEPFFDSARSAHIGDREWELFSPREKFSLPRRNRGAGILLPFGVPDRATGA